MKLSIVIPCYNMEKFLEECLDSLFRQNLPLTDFEVIIVNDESKDRTLQVAENFAVKYNNIKIIDKKNGGVGAARNSGLNLATGTYVYFLDADDLISNDSLAILLKISEENHLDILTFNSQIFNNTVPQESLITDLNDLTNEVRVIDGLDYIAQRKYRNEIWWYIINRNFLLQSEYRFIEGRWMEDAILTAQLFSIANRIGHVDLNVHWHRVYPTSAMRNKDPEHYNKIIFDNANAARVYQDIINNIPRSHEKYDAVLNRLKTRQQSFVFFLLVRFMKSDLPISKLPDLLGDFEQIDAYPLKNFLGPDYNGIDYSVMTFIFNKKPLIKPFAKVFRTFYTLAK